MLFINVLQAVIDRYPDTGWWFVNWVQVGLLGLGLGLLLCCKGELKRRATDIGDMLA